MIASGDLKPGDQLPAIREQAKNWGCTPGTVSRAYAQLAREGLVTASRGAGTRVTPCALQSEPPTWRWAALLNSAERFLLDALHSGNTPAQAQAALSIAIARWEELDTKGIPPATAPLDDRSLRFVGSHDLVVELLPRMLTDRSPGLALSLEYAGSLGGLIALARREGDLAGIHLWDAVIDRYNVPFVQRILPGQRVVLLTLFHRSMGLIVPPGNPQHLSTVADLTRPEVRMVNRQAGSGTRVWLDAQLRALGKDPEEIPGYSVVESTHLAVARTVAQGQATVGLGIQAVAVTYGLDFVPLTRERYDLALPEEVWHGAGARSLVEVVRSLEFRNTVLTLGGYDVTATGEEVWIN